MEIIKREKAGTPEDFRIRQLRAQQMLRGDLEGDDDLADLLMDVQSLLDGGGAVWLLTPKAGRPGHVPPRDVEEASSLAGLHATSSFVVDSAWAATQLVEKGHMK